MFDFLDPRFLIETFGTIGVISIVFAESGLFFGFFLPGDSLLFTAGLFASQGYLDIFILTIGSTIAAIVGDSVGYSFGRRIGPQLFSKPKSRFFKPEHAIRAQVFYEKYGVKTIVIARFVPIVRTFAPIIAGVASMKYRTFVTYNVIGGVLWVFCMTLAGFFLGKIVPGIDQYLHYIVILIILISFVPIIREWFLSKRESSQK